MSAPFFRKFTIAGPDGDGRLAYVNENGAFLGEGVPLLEKDACGLWQVRPQSELEKLFSLGYGEAFDLGWRMGRLAVVARAMNERNMGMAAIALVQTELPELPDPDWANLMARADGLCKAGYNPAEPRDAHHQKWVAAGDAKSIVAAAQKHGGWLSPNDVHRGNEKECVSLVRAVVPGLPHSGAWKQGEQLTPALVKSGAIPAGTAIAIFQNGSYNNTKKNHAAIYEGSETKDGYEGIRVVEQWNAAAGATQVGFYPFVPDGHKHFLAGQFSVIGR